jgi:hypothetical protein
MANATAPACLKRLALAAVRTELDFTKKRRTKICASRAKGRAIGE